MNSKSYLVVTLVKQIPTLKELSVGLLPGIFPEDDEVDYWFVLAEYFGNRTPDRNNNPNTFIRERDYKYFFYIPTGIYMANTRNSAYNRWQADSRRPNHPLDNVYFPIVSDTERKFSAMSNEQQRSILEDC
jgi:hypothetical protein